MKKLEERVKRILGDSPQLKILLAFYKEPASFTGMEGLMGMLQKDKETVRKIVNYPQAEGGFLPLEPGLRSLLPLSGSSRLHPGGERHVHDAPYPALLSDSASTSGSSEASPNGKPSRAHACYACYACYAWGPPTHVILLLRIYKYSAIHPQAKAWGTLALNFVDDLCEAGILIETIRLNRDHPYTKAVFKLFKEIESEGEEKRKDDIF